MTSGQPTATALAGLSSQGFDAVINLAPPTVPDAVLDEPEIVRKQGLSYVNIPIIFGKPTDSDFQEFVAAMNGFKGKKVLVHCQVNMRASSMTFLYRVVIEHQNPDKAYESVAQIWSPEGPWKQFMAAELKQAGIAFQPYRHAHDPKPLSDRCWNLDRARRSATSWLHLFWRSLVSLSRCW